eukprot:TRINITY_DN5307_c0_g1_i2.p1 TRINITY_DN5307_c0_g1~~TRINITY_DN5307_c0_g1_i2.p1  ORF type:complete len:313 (+),score=49.02 TRINITY_DN5307_c0_g1_i2:37-975(+)
MPSRSAKLRQAIVVLLAPWALFQIRSTSLLGGTQRRSVLSSEVPRQFFQTNAFDVKAGAKVTLPTTYKAEKSRTSGLVSPGKKQSPGKQSQLSEDQLAAFLASALSQPVSKDDFVFNSHKLGDPTFGTFHRCILTLPMLGGLDFQGAARSRDGARENAVLLAAAHTAQLIQKPGSNSHPKTHLGNLVQKALGIDLRKDDLVFVNQELGNMIESTLTLPILKETELSGREFKATENTAKEAELAAARLACSELEAGLTAISDTRKAALKAAKCDVAPSSNSPRIRLRQLVAHALGAFPGEGDIIYTHQEIEDG